ESSLSIARGADSAPGRSLRRKACRVDAGNRATPVAPPFAVTEHCMPYDPARAEPRDARHDQEERPSAVVECQLPLRRRPDADPNLDDRRPREGAESP